MEDVSLHAFILRRCDPATGSSVAEMRVFIADIAALAEILGFADDPDVRHIYTLDAGELAAIGPLCVPPTELDADIEVICRSHPIGDVPYLVHTNFELPLMLEGRKPLAQFWDVWPCDLLAETIDRFAPHVAEGRFVCRIIDEPAEYLPPGWAGGQLMMRRVLYALPGEEWRIDAYRELWQSPGWNSAKERREGELYGYEDWQNDWWAEHRPRFQRADG